MTWLLPALPPKWSAALRDVAARHVDARIAAAQRLGQPADAAQRAEGLAALRTSTADRDARVRAAAIESLVALVSDPRGAEPDPAATTELRAAVHDLVRQRLADSDSGVRELAALGLADLGWNTAAEGLRQALASEHPEVRFQALRAAAASGEPAVLERALALLEDEDPYVRSAAVHAAGTLRPDARPPAVRAKLRAALKDPDRSVRCEAGIALAEQAEPEAAEALLEALSDNEHVFDALDVAPSLPREDVRERVAFMAGGVLASRLVVAAAGRALARMADPRGVLVLRDTLTGFHTHGRTLSVQTIGELGLAELAADVIRLSERPRAVDPSVLAGSLASLASGTPNAREALSRLAKRSDEYGEAARVTLAASDRK